DFAMRRVGGAGMVQDAHHIVMAVGAVQRTGDGTQDRFQGTQQRLVQLRQIAERRHGAQRFQQAGSRWRQASDRHGQLLCATNSRKASQTIGRAYQFPCIKWQRFGIRKSRCWAVSTPSPTTSSASAPAISMMAVVMAKFLTSPGMPLMKLRSILSLWS